MMDADVCRGFVRPHDEAPVTVEGEEATRADVQGDTDHQANQSGSNDGHESGAQFGNGPQDDDEDGWKPLSERLLKRGRDLNACT